MDSATYRAGIIGLGFIGAGDQVSGDQLGQQVTHLDGTHFEALSRVPRIRVVAGSSRDQGRRERFASRSGARTYADWQALLQQEPLDIVSVATYAPTHAEIVTACAQAGVRVIYCEKPIATTVADAQRMVQACHAAGSLLVINHNRRFHPHYRELQRRVADGALGELTGAWITWPTGRLGNVGTHFIDALMMITGRGVRSVSARLDLSGRPDCRGPEFRDPGGWGLLELDGGAMAHLHAPDYANSHGAIVVHGTQGQLTVTGSTAQIGAWNTAPARLPPRDSAAGSSMDVAVGEILAWLDNGTPFPSPAQSAVDTLEAIVACHCSHARNGAWVHLPLDQDARQLLVNTG